MDDVDNTRGDPWDAVGAEIPGGEDCPHETFERVGSDGGNNLYFECPRCSAVRVEFGPRGSGETDRDRTVEDGSGSHPLLETLRGDPDGEKREKAAREGRTIAERTGSYLRRVLGFRERN